MKLRFAVSVVVAILLLLPPLVLPDPVRISAKKLQTWLDEFNPPLVLDVRGRELYRVGSLPGAVNAGRDPLGYLPDNNKDRVILVVPVEADEEFIEAWRLRLADAGHEVLIFDSGLDGWKEAGGTVEIHDATYTKPGRVPFVIPRGLCEGNSPAQTFE